MLNDVALALAHRQRAKHSSGKIPIQYDQVTFNIRIRYAFSLKPL